MIIALKAKGKLGFVIGKISKPNSDAPEYKKWITVDSMIISWIFNSISRDLLNGFLQGSMTLAAYYNKLKRYWDELSVLCSLLPCACGVYEHVSNQIFLLDPLPSASKAYGMVHNIEKQKKIQVTFSESSDITTVMAAQRFNNSRRQSSGDSKFNSKNKADRYCDFCQTSGHLKEKCFKLHGYPELFSDFKKQKYGAKSNNTVAFNTIAESPLDTETTNTSHSVTDNMTYSISRIVQFEILKALKGKSIQSSVEEAATAHHASSFTGIASIVDSGAIDHVSGDLALFYSISKLKTPRHVRLPDGRTKLVTHIGTIQLSPRITLFNTLYITNFHCNLLSVNYLAFTCKIFVTQYPDYCVLQYLQSKKEIAVGLVVGRLYHINKQSFSITKLWHSRLGHSSTKKMRHLFVVPIISKRLVFPSNVEHSFTIFELLHMDLWGPYRIKSVTGAYYIFTIVDDHSSPYELLYGHKPKLDYLRVIGSLCFVTNLSPIKIKFYVRGLPSVLLGYGPQQKEYKLYNLQTKQIYISKDVRFYENVFPFHLINLSSVIDFCLSECIADDMAIHSSSISVEPSVNPLVDQLPNANISDISLSYLPPSMALSLSIHNSTLVEPNIELEPLSTEIIMPEPSLSQPVKRSTRVKQTPKWLTNFIVPSNISNNTAAFTVCNSADSANTYPPHIIFSNSYNAFQAQWVI
ncbi:hypothetical protein MANES_10G077024v8 [Manihot esculenta]|uniref:Uncharacterized protein n=1 Tax=Manihot esculenta TaxID=3983 RepID=A0ACB7GYV1_MANES|nr:hypothetical protein MANES_10G077024v8 [Manihot esculenta]